MKEHLDFNNVDKIISEYLGVSKDNDMIDLKQLKKDIKKVCSKYSAQNVEYILESDYVFGRAGDEYDYDTTYPLGVKYEDIEFVDNINGIVVYKKKGSDDNE